MFVRFEDKSGTVETFCSDDELYQKYLIKGLHPKSQNKCIENKNELIEIGAVNIQTASIKNNNEFIEICAVNVKNASIEKNNEVIQIRALNVQNTSIENNNELIENNELAVGIQSLHSNKQNVMVMPNSPFSLSCATALNSSFEDGRFPLKEMAANCGININSIQFGTIETTPSTPKRGLVHRPQ